MSSEKAQEMFKDLTPQLTSYALRIIGVLFVLWLAFDGALEP